MRVAGRTIDTRHIVGPRCRAMPPGHACHTHARARTPARHSICKPTTTPFTQWRRLSFLMIWYSNSPISLPCSLYTQAPPGAPPGPATTHPRDKIARGPRPSCSDQSPSPTLHPYFTLIFFKAQHHTRGAESTRVRVLRLHVAGHAVRATLLPLQNTLLFAACQRAGRTWLSVLGCLQFNLRRRRPTWTWTSEDWSMVVVGTRGGLVGTWHDRRFLCRFADGILGLPPHALHVLLGLGAA